MATACAALYLVHKNPAFWVALAAALSEAAADTVSSEVGQAYGENARLITTWDSVPAGTNGAVSLIGTLAGVMAAASRGLSLLSERAASPSNGWRISVGAAILGMVVDSFLGAWLERRRLLNNDSVNFLSTLVAAVTAASLT